MSDGRITRYTEEHYPITAYTEVKSLKGEPFYPEWTNFVSQRSVNAIAVAPKSHYLWLATWGGVLSWNPKEGSSHRRYRSEHGLIGNAVGCICLDQAELPWVGHFEGGLSYFDGHHWQGYSYLRDEPIRALCAAVGKEGIWAAGRDTVYYIAGKDHPPNPLAPKRHNSTVEALALHDTGDYLLVGNTWGLFRLHLDNEPEMLTSDLMQTCTCLTQDSQGQVWVGTREGVYCLEDSKLIGPIVSNEIGTSRHVMRLAVARDQIWVLTTTGLAQLIERQWYSIPPPPDPTLKLYTIAADPDASFVWVGTDRLLAGVQIHASEGSSWTLNWLPLHKEDELNNLGRCIAQHTFNNRVWVGTATGMIAFSPSDEWTIHAENSNIQAISEAISIEEAQTRTLLWILTYPHGVGRWSRFQLVDFQVPQPPGLPLAMSMGQDSNPFILTGRGLWQLANGEWRAVASTIPNAARHLVQTPDGLWYAGTIQGVYYFTPEGWKFCGEQPGPLSSGVQALGIVNGRLWVAAETGLWERHTDHWRSHRAEPDDLLFDIQGFAPTGDSKAIWLARKQGIVQFDPSTKIQSVQYTPFNSGLGSYRVVALAEIDSFLWVVTHAGISRLKLS